MNGLDELLTRGVSNIIPGKKELLGKLQNGKKLNIYFGIDPTSTKIHLGHAVPLRKLNEFAQQGHNVTFLIGDFTALIGDTSDKDSERPALTIAEIDENFKTYKKQAEKILDFSKIKIRYNHEWLKKLNFEEILKLTQHFSVGDFVGRELVKKRLADNKRVGLHEFLYPVMQGYDSLMLDTDLQIGGTDQTFNMQAGRTLIKDDKKKESFVLATPILEGTDGRKMSKSWGNAIWLDDSAVDMFGKIMSINDKQIINYFLLASNANLNEIHEVSSRLESGVNPMTIKQELAMRITSELISETEAKKGLEHFIKYTQNKEVPSEINSFKWGEGKATIIKVLVDGKLAKSNSDAKRLIQQGGVKLDGKVILDSNLIINLEDEHLVKVGPRSYIKTGKY